MQEFIDIAKKAFVAVLIFMLFILVTLVGGGAIILATLVSIDIHWSVLIISIPTVLWVVTIMDVGYAQLFAKAVKYIRGY